MRQIELGQYAAADGTTEILVRAFRSGHDGGYLPGALTIRAVALAAIGNLDGARRAIGEAEQLLRHRRYRKALDTLVPIVQTVRDELASRTPDPSRLVSRFFAASDD